LAASLIISLIILRDLIDVEDRVDQITLFFNDRSRQFIEIQIKITKFILIISQIIHVKNNRSVQVFKIEKYTGIICDQHIGYQIQIIDIIIIRYIQGKPFKL